MFRLVEPPTMLPMNAMTFRWLLLKSSQGNETKTKQFEIDWQRKVFLKGQKDTKDTILSRNTQKTSTRIQKALEW